MPQLLVSVRNSVEAIAACEGGADIVDVKEPNHGSLGCAAPSVIREVGAALDRPGCRRPPLSLALDELTVRRAAFGWTREASHNERGLTSDEQALRDAIRFSAPQFLKMGFAGEKCLGKAPSAQPSWRADWMRMRATFAGDHAWVAVAYADHELAQSPPVDEVLEAAVSSDCKVLLIDTHTKNGSSLLRWLPLDDLHDIREKTTRYGLKLALAGSVSLADLSQLLGLGPDIIAVRGAVCDRSDRRATVRKDLVRQFRAAMQAD